MQNEAQKTKRKNSVVARDVDPAEPLANIRHERFCQFYAGECFGYGGKAYIAAGYQSKTNGSAETDASRLIRNEQISNRIKHLREEYGKRIAIDAQKIMDMRLEIANCAGTKDCDRLAAIRDIERALGLDAPQKIDVTTQGEKILPSVTLIKFEYTNPQNNQA